MPQNITPEEIEVAKNASPQEIQEAIEKRLKDTQAFATKSRQGEINAYKALVEENPQNLRKIPDEKILEKVLEEKWWVDSIEELEIYYPDVLRPNKGSSKGKPKDDENEELDVLTIVQRELELMKHQGTKTKINEALEKITESNKELVDTIPDFHEKMKEELKNISSNLDEKERVARAFTIVSWGMISKANAYGAIQVNNINIKVAEKKTEEDEVDALLLKKQNDLRISLWLKVKGV